MEFTNIEHQTRFLFNLAIQSIPHGENSPKEIDRVWALLVSLPEDEIHSLMNMPIEFLVVRLNSFSQSI